GEIRRDDAMVLRKNGNQVPEHVRRGREAVQQKNYRRVFRTRFAIKNPVLPHFCEPVMHGRRIHTCSGRIDHVGSSPCLSRRATTTYRPSVRATASRTI